MNDQDIKLLQEFAKDHYDNLGFYPVEFENDQGKVFDYKTIWPFIVSLHNKTEDQSNG